MNLIVIEGTTASDIPSVEKHNYSTILGNGAVLTIMDKSCYTNKLLIDFIYQTAIRNNIKIQFKQTVTGGNDAGKIQMSREGIKVASISVPCRYIHSPVSMINKNDFKSCENLLKVLLDEFSKNQDLIRIKI